MTTTLRFLWVYLQMTFICFSVFSATIIAGVCMTIFATWTLPTMEFVFAGSIVLLRFIIVASMIIALLFVLSKEGRREWSV